MFRLLFTPFSVTRLATAITDNHPRLATGGWLDLTGQAFHLLDYSPFSGRTIPSCRFQYITSNSIVKEPMYAARRRQKSFRGKFQFGKLCIGQQFQLFDNPLRQLPQGGFIGHQVALHEPQLVDKPQPDAEQEGDSLRFCPAFYCSLPSGFYKNR